MDSQGRAPDLTLFSDVKGDIVTNLNPGHGNFNLTDSDNNANNGRDGRALLGTSIAHITTRSLVNADLDLTVPGNTVLNRLALTHFSIYGNIISGGDFNGLTIDNTGVGAGLLPTKFSTLTSPYVYTGAQITIGGIYTGTAANYQSFHFTSNAPQVLAGSTTGSSELVNTNVEGQLNPYMPLAGVHGGDISNVGATVGTTLFSVGVIASGSGGTGARGGNITNVVLHGDVGGYTVLAGDGGQGATGGHGGNIVNFSDLGTTTGQSFLHSGSGGRGTLGAGGDGGTATFGVTTNASDFQVVLGAGGAGFTRGGNGASLTNTLITSPDETLPIGGKIQSTWHDIGDIGNTHPFIDPVTGQLSYSPEVIDFNGDGFGDAVYASSNPDQVVVVFGDGTGLINDRFFGLPQETIVLKVPGGGTPVITVGDFNGDGKPDIAVASNNVNNFGGINVFLNQIGDSTLNPANANNYTHNPLGDHPFSSALQTGIPTLNNFGYFAQGGAILALAAGDFNGDGITDIAYTERVQLQSNLVLGQVTGILFGDQATTLNTTPARVGAHTAPTFINGSLDNGLFNNTTGRPQGTGFFYSNAAAVNAVSGVQVSTFTDNTGPVVLHATSVLANNVPTATNAVPGLPLNPEYVVAAIQGTGNAKILTANAPNPVTHIPTSAPFPSTFSLDEVNSVGFGNVDTNRQTGADNISSQNFSVQDFQLVDGNRDGAVDLVALSSLPQTFLATFLGNAAFAGMNLFTPVSGTDPGLDNGGVYLGDVVNVPPQAVGLVAVDLTGTGTFNGFTVENLLTNGGPHIGLREFQVATGDSGIAFGQDANVVDSLVQPLPPGIGTIDRQVNSLDAFYVNAPTFNKTTNTPLTNSHPLTGYSLLAPDISDLQYVGAYFVTPQLVAARYLLGNGVSLYSGNGGNASNGVGGAAGSIGDGTLNAGTDATITASVQLRYTTSAAYAGVGALQDGLSQLVGGVGGNGFAGGGIGGDIRGVSTRFNVGGDGVELATTLVAGNGGNGISGDGGRGGGLNNVSIDAGPIFFTGNGGTGVHGGAGGVILGNQVVFDTRNGAVTLNTGLGGQGSLAGGAGGTINRWSSEISTSGGLVDYETGQGGSAAAGPGGAGGNITDSPLANNDDQLDGPLTLFTGPGGNGLVGGNGGNLTNFTNQSTQQGAVPTTLTVITGIGGTSVTGNGGTGGNVNAFQSNATGINPFNTVVAQQYNGLVRIIAGDGGLSYGGQGGAGGSLNNINSTATSTPLVAAAGQGGAGLTVGGNGGSITNSVLNSAATQIGKLLIVAGKGGDAFAALRQDIFLPGDQDVNDLAHTVLALGGQTGVGGDGGSVNNIRQPSSTQTTVDIIAGNGGSTPNAGNAGSPATGVGRGGSIGNIIAAGSIGSARRDTSLGQVGTPPIKSYSATDDRTGATTASVSEFIDFLASADSGTYKLDDTSGNVGMVAGAAGTVRGGQPAQNGINGSVNGVTAASILSIVAGSVDQVAPVAVLSNVAVTSPDGVLGADKSANAPYGPNGVLDYYNTLGINVANLEAGYRLIDGAIFATQIVDTPGQLILGPRVFRAS